MSLRVWLPLNGNLENQGLSNAVITALSTPTYSNNGKIGQCAYGAYRINYKQTNNEISIAFWICLTASSQWADIFSFGTGLNRIENISASGSTSCMQHWYNTSGSAFITGQDLFTLTVGKWTHVIMTADGQNVRFYIDGKLVKTTSQTSTVSTGLFNRDYFYIGSRDGSGGIYSANLNDFRLYDHCLSAKEVKELAKGLVLHYRLAGPGQENLVKNSQLATSWGTGDVQGCNNPTGYSFDGECIKITSGTSGNSNNGYGLLLRTSDISYSVGEKLTFSVDIKGSGQHIGLWFLGTDGNWWTGANFHTYFTQYNDWTRISVTGTVPSGTPRVMLGLHAGLSNNTLYAKNMKLERGSIATPWCPNPTDTLYSTLGYNNNIEYDCSGYCHNGTKSGNITWDVDSPKYTTSYKFNTGSDYIKTNFSKTMDELSISFWVKPSSSNGGYSIICSNYNNPPGGLWLATNCEGCSVWAYKGAYMKVSGSLANDTWHHCVYTFKAGVSKWYVNGKEKTLDTNTYTGTTLPITDLTIGNSYTGTSWNTKRYGNLSDFRFYATALSAEDIAELYHSAVIVDNTGKSYAYEYFEAN